MLDLKKKYFVAPGVCPRSEMEDWANYNTMKLVGDGISLPYCGWVYELDVRYNPNLKVVMPVSDCGPILFADGEHGIGRVRYCEVGDEQYLVVYPW